MSVTHAELPTSSIENKEPTNENVILKKKFKKKFKLKNSDEWKLATLISQSGKAKRN